MRMSCNGCRVLRKGCSENCSIRPCLQWIKSPESQANATVFLAKFYGRAGLVNLINAGPQHLRPAIFRSLLYEACGRFVNPIYGSVGLLWSGSWQLCQAAVEAVLKGAPITPINSEVALCGQGPPLKMYDIRHVSKDDNSLASDDRVKTRCRVKKTKANKAEANAVDEAAAAEEITRSTSHESSLSHQSEFAIVENEESKESESMMYVETASLLFRAESESGAKSSERAGEDCVGEIGMGLELTLGIEPPVVSRANHVVPVKKRKLEAHGTCEGDTCKVKLGFDFPAQN